MARLSGSVIEAKAIVRSRLCGQGQGIKLAFSHKDKTRSQSI